MNTKIIIGCSVGGFSGALSGYLIGSLIEKIMNRNNVQDDFEEEFIPVESIRKNHGHIIEKNMESEKNEYEEAVEYINRASDLTEEAIESVNMDIYADANPDENDDIDMRDPFFITMDDFAETNVHYDKMSATYLFNDFTLIDDNEDLLETENSIGFETYRYLRKNAEEMFKRGDHVVYIRNNRTYTDYEVTLSDENYMRDYLGISDYTSEGDATEIERSDPR